MPAQAIDWRGKRSANGSPEFATSSTALIFNRSCHSSQNWSGRCFRLSLTLLASGLFASPLGAQTIKIAQFPMPSGSLAPILPPEQDVIPPTPSSARPNVPITPPLPPPEQLLDNARLRAGRNLGQNSR
nr:hypothetical protein [Leptolyngbya sp. FACHB-321]